MRELLHPHSHDAADSVDSALEGSAEGIRAVKVSLVVLLLTAAVQAALVAVTGSVALLADTIHNVSDALTALPLWVAFALGRRRPTSRYTYGYGRAEDLAGIVVVVMIAGSAVLAGYESVRRLLDPAPRATPGWWWPPAWSASSATSWWRPTGSGSVAGSGRPRSSPTACTPAPTLHLAGRRARRARRGGGLPAGRPPGGAGHHRGHPARPAHRRTRHPVALMDAVDPALTERAADALRSTRGVVEVEYLRLRWVGHRA